MASNINSIEWILSQLKTPPPKKKKLKKVKLYRQNIFHSNNLNNELNTWEYVKHVHKAKY